MFLLTNAKLNNGIEFIPRPTRTNEEKVGVKYVYTFGYSFSKRSRKSAFSANIHSSQPPQLLTADDDEGMTHVIPVQPSLQWQVQGSSQVPCIQPG